MTSKNSMPPKPRKPTVRRWRKLAESGMLYSEIQREYPQHTVNQIRHACLGTTYKDAGGPIQQTHRWGGSNVWLRGERSPHSELTEAQAKEILEDWDPERGRWMTPGAEWARRLGVSPSTIYMLRRGETWKHLERPPS